MLYTHGLHVSPCSHATINYSVSERFLLLHPAVKRSERIESPKVDAGGAAAQREEPIAKLAHRDALLYGRRAEDDAPTTTTTIIINNSSERETNMEQAKRHADGHAARQARKQAGRRPGRQPGTHHRWARNQGGAHVIGARASARYSSSNG
eukprot:COSAG06_NODE_500_length_14997_cov_8.492549_10_plen_151_part_00